MAAGHVLGREPIEAQIGVVGAPLLGEQQHEPGFVGNLRPAGATVIARRGLRTAVQHDHQRGPGLPGLGPKSVRSLSRSSPWAVVMASAMRWPTRRPIVSDKRGMLGSPTGRDHRRTRLAASHNMGVGEPKASADQSRDRDVHYRTSRSTRLPPPGPGVTCTT
ncbi:hypothetical protein WR25_26393 [Diploscapter pachys]|uniref:Uncharacterized protein n=1 Tax=Diploscapter pachys TaxID=2018661 RepID=A0A2A2M4F5_9BILA|nr:hypothetical protein WR25_26393 [Diploscapter pachys]